MSLFDLEVIEEPGYVFHELSSIRCFVVWPIGLAMAWEVEGDDLIIPGQQVHGTRHQPVHEGARIQAMNKNHWLSVTLDEIVDFDASGIECLVVWRWRVGQRQAKGSD